VIKPLSVALGLGRALRNAIVGGNDVKGT
jgi:hypothetical protein